MVSQVEGAFVMGLGYWLTEKMLYDQESGETKTFNTWVSQAVSIVVPRFVVAMFYRPTSLQAAKTFQLILELSC